MIRVFGLVAVSLLLGGSIWYFKPAPNDMHLATTVPLVDSIPAIQSPKVEDTHWEYRSDPMPNGDQLISTISITEAGNKISFSSALTSGRMTAPDGEGSKSIENAKGTEYTFEDSFGNVGTVFISKASGTEIAVSFKITKIEDPRAMMHYESNRYASITKESTQSEELSQAVD